VDITKKINEARQRPFSKWTVQKKLKSLGINKRRQRKTLSVTEVNRKKAFFGISKKDPKL
jgi:hypothetical protein